MGGEVIFFNEGLATAENFRCRSCWISNVGVVAVVVVVVGGGGVLCVLCLLLALLIIVVVVVVVDYDGVVM